MTKSKQSNRKILLILFVGVLIGALDISIVGPAIPSIQDSMGVAQRDLGWIFSIYVLFNLIGIGLFARLSDMYGRRNLYILALGIFGLGSVLVSLSGTFPMLLVGRAVQGFGASGIFPVASAVIGDVYPPEKRGAVLGMIGAVFGLAFLIGPILAGTLLLVAGWPILFLINIPPILFLLWGSWKVLPSVPVSRELKVDWAGIFLLALLLSSFALGVNRLDATALRRSLLSGPVLVLFAVFLFSSLIFIRVEMNHADPIVKPRMFYNRQIRLVGILALGTGLMQASFVFIPDFAVGGFAVTSSTASFMLTPLVLATALGSPVFGRQLDRSGSRIVIQMGLVLAATGFLLLWRSAGNHVLFYAAGIGIGLGMSVLSGSSLRYIMLNEAKVVDRASTQGMLTIFVSLGQITGSAFVGMITAGKTSSTGYERVFLALGLLLVLLVAFSGLLKNREAELALQANPSTD